MKQMFLLLSVLGLTMMNGYGNVPNDPNQPNKNPALKQHEAQLARPVTMELGYLIYLPEDYGKVEKDWPLMVFLHGFGERGSDLNKVKVHGPPKLIEEGKDFPFIVVSPQCPDGKWWPYVTERVIALIDDIVDNYDVDEDRVYLTGLSMGGYGTWAAAGMYPDRFAAIAPICGGGISHFGYNLKNVPVWAFHGGKDPVVPVKQSREMVNAVKQAGGNANLTVYPGVGHDSWTRTYNNDKLYEWLLSHSRKQD